MADYRVDSRNETNDRSNARSDMMYAVSDSSAAFNLRGFRKALNSRSNFIILFMLTYYFRS